MHRSPLMEGVLQEALSVQGLSEHQERPEVLPLQASKAAMDVWFPQSASGHIEHRPDQQWRAATEPKVEKTWIAAIEYDVLKDRQARTIGQKRIATSEYDVLKVQRDRGALFNLIRACGKQKDLQKGSRLHADILESGLLRKDINLAGALLSMYVKCGALAKVQELFDELPARNVVTWNVLIGAYAQQGLGYEALSCYKQMQDEGLSPNAATFICILKACGSIGAVEKGEEIHAEINRQGLLEKNIMLGTALVHMYVKCGALAKAQRVFVKLPARDVVAWNVLVAGYAQHGLGNEALRCFERMGDEGLSPDVFTFVCLLKACGSIQAEEKGEEIHIEVNRQGLLEKDVVLGTALVDMYAKCGALAKAQGVFDKLPVRNIVTWNALIAGYTLHGFGDEALSCFGQMREEGFSPDAITFSCILRACGSIGAVEKGREIHAEVRRQGLLGKDRVLGTALLDMYAKCGELAEAQCVFNKLRARDVPMWTALIAGYAQHGLGDEALRCFGRMQDEGLSPDAVTYACILKACGSVGAVEKGEEIHAEVRRQGLLEKDNGVGNALVDMYAKCGALVKAQGVFDMLRARSIATWNALIAGYAQHGFGAEALKCYGRMRDEGLIPDAVTFACILKACSSIGALEKGEDIHAEVHRQGLLEKDVVLGNALVDMYTKCGALAKAQDVFDNLSEMNTITWNVLIAGYVQHGRGDEALTHFDRMREKGFSPDAVTFIYALKACGSIGAAEKGKEIHVDVRRQGLLEIDSVLGNALVDMYAKCGTLSKAQEVFDELPAWDIATWTTLMAGYAQVGKVNTVFDCFIKMVKEGKDPDVVTFVVLLTACSHAGLVEQGQMYFDTMSNVYGIIPTLEHRTCMIDIFSRAGQFDKAISVIEKGQPSGSMLLWSAVMGACQKSMNMELGKRVFEHVARLDEKFAAGYVYMINMYAAAGMQEKVDEVDASRMKNGAWKTPERCWWIDARKTIQSFSVGCNSHPESERIHAKIEDIGRKLWLEGYSPPLQCALQAISDDEKENMVCGHTVKLGIAFALISTPEGTPIRVTKNMRICGDCHFVTLLISKMEKCRIQVADANCIHIFEDGVCHCESY